MCVLKNVLSWKKCKIFKVSPIFQIKGNTREYYHYEHIHHQALQKSNILLPWYISFYWILMIPIFHIKKLGNYYFVWISQQMLYFFSFDKKSLSIFKAQAVVVRRQQQNVSSAIINHNCAACTAHNKIWEE